MVLTCGVSRRMSAICMAFAVTQVVMGASGTVELLKDGRSRHRIILEAGASPSEAFAARELREHFKACTGIEFPIDDGASSQDAPMIVLGCGAVARSLGVDPRPEDLGEQGYILRTVPPHIVIAGTRAAGTLYGVHRFLEECLGVRWYAPGVTRTPRVTEVKVPPIDRLVRPAFSFRNTSYTWPGGGADFRSRMADNRGRGDAASPYGVGYDFDGTCHSYFSYVSPEEFFDEHPEYFSEIGGVRIREETQLCLTNPDLLRIVTERMLERMKGQPNVRQHNFSQMDHYNECTCARCREINERQGTSGGTQYWFINRLAEQTAKVYPDKLIGTLAYTYTEEPPKDLKMHPNVAVWLCHMFPCCDSHPIATCPRNADYKRRALEWSRICRHLYVWHYIVNFAHYYSPFPNLRAMAADMKFYRDIGAEGVYLQGVSEQGGGGELSVLRPYYGMKLLWDPDQDADALLQDFLAGYYGPASGNLWDYIALLHDKVAADGVHMHLYTNPAQGYLPDDLVQRALRLFDQAEAAVKDDPELLERVRIARMPLTYARIFPRNGYALEDGRLRWLGEPAPLAEAIEFLQRMRKHGFTSVREIGGEPEQMVDLGGLFSGRPEVARIESSHLTADVVPLLAGRILRIIERKTGLCATAHNVPRCLYFPFSGGLESRVGETFRFHGWMEPAVVQSRTEASVSLELRTNDGLRLKRVAALAPDRPILEVVTTVTNPGPKPVVVRLREHLELDLGDLRSTRVRFTRRDGKQVEGDMVRVIGGLREGEHHCGLEAPAGSWTLSGSKGLEVTQTFDPVATDFTWLYAYPEDLGQLDAEVWRRRQRLEPGESLTSRQSIEVRPASRP